MTWVGRAQCKDIDIKQSNSQGHKPGQSSQKKDHGLLMGKPNTGPQLPSPSTGSLMVRRTHSQKVFTAPQWASKKRTLPGPPCGRLGSPPLSLREERGLAHTDVETRDQSRKGVGQDHPVLLPSGFSFHSRVSLGTSRGRRGAGAQVVGKSLAPHSKVERNGGVGFQF